MKTMFLISIFCATAVSSCNRDKCKPAQRADCYCIEIYDPVCGCDGMTYSNSCHAECNSIYEYTKGEC